MKGLGGVFRLRPSPVQQYVGALMRSPLPSDVAWLGEVATGGDTDRAEWELRYLARALGLLVAQRDALDDRTGSLVARALGDAMQVDRQVAAPMVRLAERQFNERLSAYREMLAMRGVKEAPVDRVARTLLLLSGATLVRAEDMTRAATVVERILFESGAALREAFGEARFPGPNPG